MYFHAFSWMDVLDCRVLLFPPDDLYKWYHIENTSQWRTQETMLKQWAHIYNFICQMFLLSDTSICANWQCHSFHIWGLVANETHSAKEHCDVAASSVPTFCALVLVSGHVPLCHHPHTVLPEPELDECQGAFLGFATCHQDVVDAYTVPHLPHRMLHWHAGRLKAQDGAQTSLPSWQ